MAGIIKGFTAEVKNLQRNEDGDALVEVRVKGFSRHQNVPGFGRVSVKPDTAANLRARARALLAAGPVPSSVETVKQVSIGDIQRLTEIIESGERGSGRVIDKMYLIKVSG